MGFADRVALFCPPPKSVFSVGGYIEVFKRGVAIENNGSLRYRGVRQRLI